MGRTKKHLKRKGDHARGAATMCAAYGVALMLCACMRRASGVVLLEGLVGRPWIWLIMT